MQLTGLNSFSINTELSTEILFDAAKKDQLSRRVYSYIFRPFHDLWPILNMFLFKMIIYSDNFYLQIKGNRIFLKKLVGGWGDNIYVKYTGLQLRRFSQVF